MALELSAAPDGLLDDPLIAGLRGVGPDPGGAGGSDARMAGAPGGGSDSGGAGWSDARMASVPGGGAAWRARAAGAVGGGATWRARLRDDDGRVWRATAARADQLAAAWAPAKASAGPIAALRSLRPVRIDLRAELEDGRSASRTITRRLVADGVRTRRWRDGLAATLHRPAGEPCASVVLDATAGGRERPSGADPDSPTGPTPLDVAALAGPLLAARGVLVLVVGSPPRGATAADALALARDRLAAVPGAPAEVAVVAPILPPGVPAIEQDHAARAAAWDALLAQLGARPRNAPRAG